MALQVEGVMDGGVHAEEPLRGGPRFEALHLALAPSHHLMRVLDPIVLSLALFMVVGQPEVLEGSPVGAQLVGDHPFRRLLAERGLDISYEGVRGWVLKFGPAIARRLRKCRPCPSDRPLPGETIVPKRTNSAFIGTDLDRLFRQAKLSILVILGVITNNSLEATVRMAGNLGFDTYLVEDASFTFARSDYRGRLRTAEDVHDMSLANLGRQYCTVTRTEEVLNAVRS